MKSLITKENIFILIGLIVLGTASFFDVHVKNIEEVRPVEIAPGALIHEEEFLPQSSGQQIKFEGTNEDIIRLTNQERKEKGLKEYIVSDRLMFSAQKKAQDMKRGEYFAHTSPDGVEFWSFVQQAEYEYKSVSENIAEGYYSAPSVVDAWMNSEGHRKNILSVDFEEMGVAILDFKDQEGNESYVLVQHFGLQTGQDAQAEQEVVCEKEIKKNCSKIEDKKDELRELVKEQDKVIETAEKEGYSRKDLIELYDNLDNLKDYRNEMKEHSKECEEFKQKCDRWE